MRICSVFVLHPSAARPPLTSGFRLCCVRRAFLLTLQLFQDDATCVEARQACYAAARVCPSAAEIKSANRSAVLRPANDGTKREKLVERRLTVKCVSAGQAILVL